MSDIGGDSSGALRELPDRDLVDFAYICALDAMTASENYETMTRVRSANQATRRQFAAGLRDAHETMAAVSHSTRAPAPAELRSRVLEALDSTSQERPDAGVVSLDGRRNRRTLRRAIVAAAAAVAVIAVGGVVVGQQVTQNDSSEQVIADGPRSVSVDGGGTVSLTPTGTGDSAVVRFDGLAPPPAGSVYQMWLLDDDARSAGLVDSAALGTDRTVSAIGSATSFAVTVEPAGGSAQPTSDVIAEIAL